MIANVLGRMIISATFLYAAHDKIVRPDDFQSAILDYQIIGTWWSAALAYVLPGLELACGLAIWTNYLRQAALWTLLAMVFGFLLAVSSALLRGLPISCGCFGNAGHDLVLTFAVDIILLAILAFLVKSARAVPSRPTPST